MTADYERLSFLDSSFLAMESRSTHFHVAGLLIFEAAPLRREDGGIDIARIASFVESRLHLVPRYRQRLALVPFERHPVWVDDEHFNVDYHIRHSSLPKPGTVEQLKLLMGRLCSQQLDRSKPLWELHVVEGLAHDRFAIISKIHHAMIDGISGVDLMAVLLNLAPTADVTPAPPFEPRPAPSGAELVLRETARRAGRAAAALRSVQTLSEDVQSIALEGARRVRAMRHSLGSGWLTPATKTPLNGVVGPNRRFETLQTPLADIKEIKNSLGGTVNDVILATVAGGVRSFLVDERGFDVAGVDFRVMAPVSVRSPSQRGTLGNQVAMWLAALPVGEADPAARLAAVSAETEKLKRTDQALGAASLVRMSSGAPATLVSLASRLATGARPFNMTVTNVPGPQFPFYLLESALLEQYPLVPLWHGHGVGIALFSYNGSVSWGFNADYDVMYDLGEFVGAIEAAFKELLAVARGAEVPVGGARQPSREAATRTAVPKQRPPMGTGAAKPGAAKPAAAKQPAAKSSGTKSSGAKKSAARSSAAKSSTAKSSGAKKSAAKSSAAKSSAARKPAAKSSAARSSAAKSSAARKLAARSSAAKSRGTKSSGAKKPATKSSAAKSSGTESSASKQPAAKSSAKRRPPTK